MKREHPATMTTYAIMTRKAAEPRRISNAGPDCPKAMRQKRKERKDVEKNGYVTNRQICRSP